MGFIEEVEWKMLEIADKLKQHDLGKVQHTVTLEGVDVKFTIQKLRDKRRKE